MRSFGLVRPCSVGAVSCCLVVVTAADRAAATCRRWGRGHFSERSASPPRPPSPEERLGIGLCVPSDLCAHAAWVRFLAAWLWSRRLTEPPRPADAGGEAASQREAPLPQTPSSEERLGMGLCVPSDLCAHAAWVRFLAAWLWSRRLTEPPRPAARSDASDLHAFKL